MVVLRSPGPRDPYSLSSVGGNNGPENEVIISVSARKFGELAELCASDTSAIPILVQVRFSSSRLNVGKL